MTDARTVLRLSRTALALAAVFAVSAVSARPLRFSDARPYGTGFETDGDTVICTARDVAAGESRKLRHTAGLVWHVRFDQKEARPVRFSAEGLPETLDATASYRVYVDVTFADGSHQWGVTTAFDTVFAAGWHRREVTVNPRLPIRSLACYLFVRGGEGKVRFRDPSVEELQPDNRPLLDGVFTPPSRIPAGECFLVRDAAGEGCWESVSSSGTGTRLDWSCTTNGAARKVRAELSGGRDADRAVTLVYAVPLPRGEMTWFDSPRRSVPLTAASPEQHFIRYTSAGRGLSAWPFGAVEADGKGFAIGIDPSFPAIYRVAVSPRHDRLFIAFDIGLVPEKPSATVGFVVFPFDPADGFRGALETYRALYPAHHAVRAGRQGNWMAFHSISNLPGHADFGFRFKEGTRETAWDDAQGIYTFHYGEPCTWWMRLGKSGDGAVKTTLQACREKAEYLAARGDSAAKSWLACAVKDAAGRPYGQIRDTPWCNGIVWSLNCLPGIAGDFTEYGRKWSEEKLVGRYGAVPRPFPEGLDGEYLDSANLPVTCPFDFDRSHFSAMKAPLSFTSGPSPRVGIPKALMVAECVAAVAESVHGRGKLVMANTTPVSTCLLSFNLDVMGIETNWKQGGKWSPMSDDEMMYRRAVCGAKPFCFLQNTDFSRFTKDDSERYMLRCLAYGMFPSYFSANAATGHYFSRPDLYERDRPLFRRYLPLITEIAEAGWRPVNRLLSVDSPDVFAERFGDRHVTLFNPETEFRTVTLSCPGGARTADELLTGEKWVIPPEGLRVELPPETCRLLKFR